MSTEIQLSNQKVGIQYNEKKPEIQYNEGQQHAIARIGEAMFPNQSNRALLTGAAGTGKTTVFQKIIEEYQYRQNQWGDERAICIAAPTNKAVKVAKKMAAEKGLNNLQFKTLHSLLGLMVEEREGRKGLKQRDINLLCDEYSLIVVDESSMIDSEIADKFFYEAHGCNVLGVGDIRQLPPVKKGNSKEMFPFFWYFDESMRSHLTETMRSKGSPIGYLVDACSDAVEKNTKNFDPRKLNKLFQFTPDCKSGAWLMGTDNFYKFIVQAFGKQKEENFWDKTRVLCFYHKSIEQINHFIRVSIYGESANQSDYLPWEPLICLSPVVRSHYDDESGDLVKQIIFPTSTELTVVDARLGVQSIEIDKDIKTYPCWYVQAMDEEGIVKELKIVPNANKESHHAECEYYKKKAIESDRSYWHRYYALMNAFDNVRVAYGLTVYSSQGSTFENVFVVGDDIAAVKDQDLRRRSFYVALSRASSKIILQG